MHWWYAPRDLEYQLVEPRTFNALMCTVDYSVPQAETGQVYTSSTFSTLDKAWSANATDGRAGSAGNQLT
jgi:hypothetical protein